MREAIYRAAAGLDEQDWLEIASEIVQKGEGEREAHEVILLGAIVEVMFGI